VSNVVPLRPHAAETLAARHAGARATGALVSDLVAVVAQLREAGAQAAGLPRPPIEIERTVQHILDAVTAVERALDTATDGGELTPF
jgi:hypothetical protein